MKPNLKKISELTGYSVATVSNTLSGNRKVSQEAANKIFSTAREIGYITMAKIKRVKLVSLRITGKIFDSTPFFTPLIDGVSAECAACGYDLTYVPLDVDSPSFSEHLRKLQSDMNSAVILIGSEMTGEEYHYFENFSVPIVTLDYWCPNYRFNGVEINNYDAAYLATNYLISKGHTRIGYLRGDFRIRAFHERGRGYRGCMFDHELFCPDSNILTLGVTADRAYNDMLSHLSQERKMPTAFFADDDIIALGAIKALQEKGFRIPQDISIMGFDDISYCTVSTPALTSMHVPAYEMGSLSVRRLHELMEHKDSVITRTQVCVTITERDSICEHKYI